MGLSNGRTGAILARRSNWYRVILYPGIRAAMTGSGRNDRRHALGAFLRAQRERLAPSAVGLAQGPRRRTPGLRREELAQPPPTTAPWATWPEPSRAASPPPAPLP